MTRSTIEHDEQTTSVLLGEQDPRRGAVGLRDGPERVQRVYRVGAEQPGLSPERPPLGGRGRRGHPSRPRDVYPGTRQASVVCLATKYGAKAEDTISFFFFAARGSEWLMRRMASEVLAFSEYLVHYGAHVY